MATRKTNAKKVSLHVQVPEVQTQDIAKDALRFRKTKDAVVQAALMMIFALKPEERSKWYDKLPNKIYGRPLKKAAVAVLFLTTLMTATLRADLVGHPGAVATNHKSRSFSNPSNAVNGAASFRPLILAQAIWLAEGGNKASHPFGILSVRPASYLRCVLKTISHAQRDFHGGDFIAFLGDRYCPIKADPKGNRNWKHNVRILYAQLNRK